MAAGVDMNESEDDVLTPGRMATLFGAALVFGIETTGAYVAVPYIAADFDVPRSSCSWVIIGFVIASAAMTPCTGWLESRFGQRSVLFWSLLLAAAVGLACSMAPNLELLVIGRVVQGALGAPVYPLTLSALIGRHEGARRDKLVSWWSAVSFLGPVAGPGLAGLLIGQGGWRLSFITGPVLSLILAASVLIFITDRRNVTGRALDFRGLAFLAFGLACLLLSLSPQLLLRRTYVAIALVVAACLFLAQFMARSKKIASPLLNVGLLENLRFLRLAVSIFCAGAIDFSLGLLIPLTLTSQGFTSVDIGLLVMPRSLATLVGALLVAKAFVAPSNAVKAFAGLLVAALGTALLYVQGESMSAASIVVAGILQGLGSGVAGASLNVASLGTLAPSSRTDGSAIRVVVRTVGGSVGISVVSLGLALYAVDVLSGVGVNSRSAEACVSLLGWLALFGGGLAIFSFFNVRTSEQRS
jgi:DHA2 family multidrug resistance protein